MAIKKYNPTSPGRRHMSVQGFDEITAKSPEKSLLAIKKKSGGRKKQITRSDAERILEKCGAASVEEVIEELERQMLLAAENLEFERAAELRDQIRALQKED